MVVVLAIIILLAGIVVPEVRNYLAEAKTARILAIYHATAKAAMEFWGDTGQYPLEDTDDQRAAAHPLFYKQEPNLAGWSGPYSNHPLTEGENPLKGRIYLADDLLWNNPVGWDLDGDGTFEVPQNGPVNPRGSMLVFFGEGDLASDPVLLKVEAEIDGKVLPAGVAADSGRVKWLFDGGQTLLFLYIFTMER